MGKSWWYLYADYQCNVFKTSLFSCPRRYDVVLSVVLMRCTMSIGVKKKNDICTYAVKYVSLKIEKSVLKVLSL